MKILSRYLSVFLIFTIFLTACSPLVSATPTQTINPDSTETFANTEVPAGNDENIRFPTSRDPIYWPFAVDSIWNMPIHNNAVYVDAGISAHMPLDAGPTTDWEPLILSPNAPLKDLVENNAGWDGNPRCEALTGVTLLTGVPVPDNFFNEDSGGGNTPNNSGAILMPDGLTVYETQPLQVCSPNGIVTSQYIWPATNIRSGDGIEGSHGGSGLSALGGSLRVGDLMPGSVIHHALKMNFYALYNYAYNDDGTPGYRWPAQQADGYASPETYGGKIAAFEQGSLLALKPDFDFNSLQTEPAKILAHAAQDYGIYAVDDTAWDVFALNVEAGSLGNAEEQFSATYGYGLSDGPLMNCKDTSEACKWSQDMWTILSHLNVIDNNTAETIGGGANSDTTNRRAPMAPPFIPIVPTVTPTFGPSPTPRPTSTASPTSLPTATSEPGWTIVDDAAPDVWTYTGSFGDNVVRNSNNLGGTQSDPWQDGDYAEITFTGTQVNIYGVKFPGAVTADIYIDDMETPIATGVNWDNPTTVYRSLIWISPVLSSGKHTLRIVCRGDWISFDYISYK